MNRILTVCYVSLLVLVIDDANFLKTPACGLPHHQLRNEEMCCAMLNQKLEKNKKATKPLKNLRVVLLNSMYIMY